MTDAVVVGSGPNGLAAAITLAREGLEVEVLEAAPSPGGGIRSAELTLPGFTHDVCATVLALLRLSPFFGTMDLGRHGLRFADPPAPVGHALDERRGLVLERDVAATAERLGRDGPAWLRLMDPLVGDVPKLLPWLLGPPVRVTRHLPAQARFGLHALLPAAALAGLWFRDAPARALFAGLASHSMLSLRAPASASFGLVLGMLAHVDGWPVVQGGSGALVAALVAELRSLGGEVHTGRNVTSLAELPPRRATILDVSPRAAAAICGDALPGRARRQLERYRYGPGVCKVDWALDGPIPWADPDLARAGTVHVGGPIADMVRSESDVHRGRAPRTPYVLLVQATLADPSRAPRGRHTAWAYCHVPHGSAIDMTEAIEARVERFAPGFRDRVLARVTRTAPEMEAYDANYVGGDINVGLQDLRQIVARPRLAMDPYRLPGRGLYLCSSATPPGGGVHGMCGSNAARSALRHEFGIRV